LVWTKRFPAQEQTGDAQSTSEVDGNEITK